MGQASSKIIDSVSKEILRKIELQRKITGMTQKEFSLKMEGGPQWLTKKKQFDYDYKVSDLIKAGDVLNINPLFLLPDEILENIHNENIENAIKTLSKKGYRVILEESELRKHKDEENE